MAITVRGGIRELPGREGELSRLRAAWRRAEAGRTEVVLLAGEAGMGKTTVARWFAAELDQAGAAVSLGSCPDRGAEPWHPLVEAGLLPDPAAAGSRDRLLAALAEAVAARARRTPVLLVLDDVHRADRSTLLALRHLVDAVAVPVLVLATYRDAVVDPTSPLSELLAVLTGRPDVERLALDGIPEDAVPGLAADLGLPVDGALARRIWRHTAGHPLFTAELLRLGVGGEEWPRSLEQVVRARVDRLPARARRVLEAAALVGEEFHVPVVAAATGLTPDRAQQALEQAEHAGLVAEAPAPPGARAFTHEMIRQAVEHRVTGARRVRLHRAVGEALERLGPTFDVPAAAVAWQYRAAAPVGSSVHAVRASVRAADRAMALLAWDEAAEHYGHALAEAPRGRPGPRADLLLALGEAQRLAGEPARARQAFLEAADAARSCRDASRLARAALALGEVSAVWGNDPVLDRLAGEARSMLGSAAAATAEAPSGGAPPGPARAPDFRTGELYDFLDGVPLAPPAGEPEPAGTAEPAPPRPAHAAPAALLRARHLALAGPERAADRLAAADETVALATELGDPDLALAGSAWRMTDLLELGRLEEADAEAITHAALARRSGHPRHLRDAVAWEAMRTMLDGRPDDARAAADEALALGTQADDPAAGTAFWVQRWWLALEWGTPDELPEIADACREQASGCNDPTEWRASLALLLARRGQLELAAEELRRATARPLTALAREPGRLHPLASLAEVAWLLGDARRAAALVPHLQPFAGHLVVAGRGLACRGSVARACALSAAANRRWAEAERQFKVALATHERIGARPLLARTHYDRARVLVERGRKVDSRRAGESLRASVELATALGMHRLLHDAQVLRDR